MSAINRRELLAMMAACYGGGLLGLLWPRTALAAASSATPIILSPKAWRTVEAMTGRILPSEEGSPGAIEAGCVNFIDKALANEESTARILYEKGVPALNAIAKKRHNRAFGALSPAQQDDLLAALEQGKIMGWPDTAGDAAVFFETVRTHTLLGFLSDPKYGGNRDWVGWKHMGYPGPRHEVGGYTPDEMVGKAAIQAIWDRRRKAR